MNRRELLIGITAACAVTGEDSVVIFGSQAILGSFSESVLPDAATQSREMDAAPRSFVEIGVVDEQMQLLIEAELGEWSRFHMANKFYVETISPSLPIVPTGWQDRLVKFPSDGTYGTTGYCLSK